MERSTDAAALAAGAMPPITSGGRLQLNCDRHGVFMAKGARLRTRSVWDVCPDCAAERYRVESEERRLREAVQAKRDLEDKIDRAAIPLRFIGKTLDTFVADTDGKRYAATVARDYIENFERHYKKGDGLILSGMPGTGKSHIAAAVLQGILPRWVGMYATCMTAIRAVRETWRKDSDKSEREVLNILGTVPLLVLDEIGVQYGTEGEQTIIFDILDRRYRDMMPSILLTNQDKAGFKTFIGDRAYDRLTETCRWVPFDWASHRPQARKDAA